MRKKLLKKIAPIALGAVLVILPTYAFAQSQGIVPPCNKTINSTGQFENPCDWDDFVKIASNVLQWMVFIAVPLGTLAFAYAGWLYLSAQGSTGKVSKAHSIFLNVAIGLALVITAWVIVDFILKGLAKPGSYIQILGSPGGESPNLPGNQVF